MGNWDGKQGCSLPSVVYEVNRTEMVDLGGDYTKIAQGLGSYAERVEEPEEFIPALKRSIAVTKDGQAAVLECELSIYSTEVEFKCF